MTDASHLDISWMHVDNIRRHHKHVSCNHAINRLTRKYFAITQLSSLFYFLLTVTVTCFVCVRTLLLNAITCHKERVITCSLSSFYFYYYEFSSFTLPIINIVHSSLFVGSFVRSMINAHSFIVGTKIYDEWFPTLELSSYSLETKFVRSSVFLNCVFKSLCHLIIYFLGLDSPSVTSTNTFIQFKSRWEFHCKVYLIDMRQVKLNRRCTLHFAQELPMFFIIFCFNSLRGKLSSS